MLGTYNPSNMRNIDSKQIYMNFDDLMPKIVG